ncbi:MAG: GNAT family N-acetyltransferase [Bacillota bacterium]
MGVKPEYRSQGLGAELLNAVLARLSREDYLRLHMDTAASNLGRDVSTSAWALRVWARHIVSFRL